MALHEALLTVALERPDVVIESPTDRTIHLYYKDHDGDGPGTYICCVVKLSHDPFLVTAYVTN